jgi:hypothetical protein
VEAAVVEVPGPPAAKAGQLRQIAALYAERVELLGIGQGDPALSVIGEITDGDAEWGSWQWLEIVGLIVGTLVVCARQ